MNNLFEKNKSAVILNPEAGVKISGASVEPVINDGAKTKRYSARRDLYGDFAYAQPLKMTALAFLLSLNLSTAFADNCTCSWSGADNKTLTIKDCPDGALSMGSCANLYTANNIIIGTGVTSIGNGAFQYDSSLESITIPDSVTSIGDNAFYFTSSLTSITIPDSVTSIGDNAFTTTGLTSITIPEGVTRIGNYAFSRTSSLESITIPDSVTSIGNQAFWDAKSLTSIKIPEGVTYIGEHAFRDASSLTSITIPDNIDTKNWAASVFYGFPKDTDIVCQGDLNTCYEKLAKYIPTDKGGDCTYSSYCISPDRIIKATDPSQCSGNYGWSGAGCAKKDSDGKVACASGFVEWDKQCLSEYPFAKKRWTPAEANQWLHDGNDNFVVITFKK